MDEYGVCRICKLDMNALERRLNPYYHWPKCCAIVQRNAGDTKGSTIRAAELVGDIRIETLKQYEELKAKLKEEK